MTLPRQEVKEDEERYFQTQTKLNQKPNTQTRVNPESRHKQIPSRPPKTNKTRYKQDPKTQQQVRRPDNQPEEEEEMMEVMEMEEEMEEVM